MCHYEEAVLVVRATLKYCKTFIEYKRVGRLDGLTFTRSHKRLKFEPFELPKFQNFKCIFLCSEITFFFFLHSPLSWFDIIRF